MYRKFGGDSGGHGTPAGLFAVVLLTVCVVAVVCVGYTAGRVYQGHLLRCLAFLPVMALLLLLGGIACGVFYLLSF